MKRRNFLIFLALPGFLAFWTVPGSHALEGGKRHETTTHRHMQHAQKNNPFPATEQSVESGSVLFRKNCIACHGEVAQSDHRRNLGDAAWVHGGSDGEIFHVITDGVKGTMMKGFRGVLTDEMRWHLVNYLKSASSSGKPAKRPGSEIRIKLLDGYTLTYHLLDLSERGEMVKMMGRAPVIGMSTSPDVSNHLMVYIEKPDGKIVPASVLFLVTGPDGNVFRTMTMGMYGGYGADVLMKRKGTYTIRTKAVSEHGRPVRLDDEFTFTVQ